MPPRFWQPEAVFARQGIAWIHQNVQRKKPGVANVPTHTKTPRTRLVVVGRGAHLAKRINPQRAPAQSSRFFRSFSSAQIKEMRTPSRTNQGDANSSSAQMKEMRTPNTRVPYRAYSFIFSPSGLLFSYFLFTFSGILGGYLFIYSFLAARLSLIFVISYFSYFSSICVVTYLFIHLFAAARWVTHLFIHSLWSGGILIYLLFSVPHPGRELIYLFRTRSTASWHNRISSN